MSLIGRLRRGGSVVALLTAVLLFAPMHDCTLVESDGHTHSADPSAAEVMAASALEGLSHITADSDGAHCAPHFAHCIVKSVPRWGIDNLPSLQLLGFGAAAVLVVAVGLGTAIGGVRGPPIAALPAPGGRATLTQFCISRR